MFAEDSCVETSSSVPGTTTHGEGLATEKQNANTSSAGSALRESVHFHLRWIVITVSFLHGVASLSSQLSEQSFELIWAETNPFLHFQELQVDVKEMFVRCYVSFQ